jgi:hypothetical protein
MFCIFFCASFPLGFYCTVNTRFLFHTGCGVKSLLSHVRWTATVRITPANHIFSLFLYLSSRTMGTFLPYLWPIHISPGSYHRSPPCGVVDRLLSTALAFDP